MKALWKARLLAVATTGWMATAQAADITYTFNVPLALHQLPTAMFDKVAVVCGLEAGAERLASSAPVEVALDAGGHAVTTVAVPVTLAESAATRARLWRCQLLANVPGRGYLIPQGLAFRPVAGTNARLEVMGDLP